MNNKTEFPIRRHTRLSDFDYSSNGAYFITICTQNKRCILSCIERVAEAENSSIHHTLFGCIAKEQLLLLEKRFPHLSIDQYVIMPNHIHAILILNNQETVVAIPENAARYPTIMDIVCAYKSLTTRECRKNGFSGKLFQTSFYEHIIRDYSDYEEISKYIYENPLRWYYDELYTEE